jgi:hypothetical protein
MKIHHGYIQCIFSIAGSAPHNSFYEDQQTHTWEIGNSPPITNALQQFPVTWYVAGSGDLREDNGVGTVRTAQWFRIFKPEQETMQVRLSGNMIIVGASTSVSAPGAIHLFSQQTMQNPSKTEFSATPIAWPTILWDPGVPPSYFHKRFGQPPRPPSRPSDLSSRATQKLSRDSVGASISTSYSGCFCCSASVRNWHIASD